MQENENCILSLAYTIVPSNPEICMQTQDKQMKIRILEMLIDVRRLSIFLDKATRGNIITRLTDLLHDQASGIASMF